MRRSLMFRSMTLPAALCVFPALAWLAVSPASAQAPQRCPEGRTAAGKCVNPELAQDQRTGTSAYTLPKLSMTNPPVMPSQDGAYYVPRDHHEISNLHGYPPVTNRSGVTTSFTTLDCRAGCTTVTTTVN